MTDSRREQLSRLSPAVGSCLTLTIVLLASLAPNAALSATDALGSRADSAPAVRRSAGLDPVLVCGVVIGQPACSLAATPVVPSPSLKLGGSPAASQAPATPGPDPRLAPVRGP